MKMLTRKLLLFTSCDSKDWDRQTDSVCFRVIVVTEELTGVQLEAHVQLTALLS